MINIPITIRPRSFKSLLCIVLSPYTCWDIVIKPRSRSSWQQLVQTVLQQHTEKKHLSLMSSKMSIVLHEAEHRALWNLAQSRDLKDRIYSSRRSHSPKFNVSNLHLMTIPHDCCRLDTGISLLLITWSIKVAEFPVKWVGWQTYY